VQSSYDRATRLSRGVERLGRALALGVAVGWLATGCDANRADESAPTAVTPPPSSPSSISTTATASSTSSAADRTTQAVLAAYDGMWADMTTAARTADYGSPVLAAHTVDPATGQLRRMLLAFHDMGWVAKGQPVPQPTVVSVSAGQPPTAQIADCLDETQWLTYRADTGALTDTKPGQRFAVTAVVRQASDGWKVESFDVGAGGSC
jgi:hypothetical protein